MNALVDRILSVPPVLAYLLVGALVFAEDALFVGFVVPGETAAVIGGVLASRGRLPLPGVLVLVVLAAVVGDSAGYQVGRVLGPRVLQTRLLRRRRERLAAAQDFLARRGGSAVFLGRFVAFFRAVLPALAGMSRMPYPRFLAFNAAGGLSWGAAFVLVGYLAGNSYQRVEKLIGRGTALVVLVVVLAGLVAWSVRRHRREAARPAGTTRTTHP